jgi:hypothetical protein
MSKRKRSEERSPAEDSSDIQKIQQLKIQITRGISELSASLEQARRFERQKLGKRQHDKNRGDADSRKLNIEIASLKALDMKTVATNRLHKNLVKTQSIAKTGLLPDDVKMPTTGTIDKTTADLMARLFKHRGAVEALETTMTAVRKILGVQSSMNGVSKRQKLEQPHQRKDITSQSPEHTTPHDETSLSPSDETAEQPHKKPKAGSNTNDISDSEEEFTAFDDRLASSSSENDEFPQPPGVDSESESDPYDTTIITKTTTSAFLPSLSMGGYMSNSDSDATDVEDHIAPRKNRRGQRARQAIWEKKFKDKAKHLKDPPKKQKKDKRDEGWDLQKGAVSSDASKANKRLAAAARRRDKGPSGGNTAPMGKKRDFDDSEAKPEKKEKHRDDAGSLHPSWRAKKQMKQQTVGIGGFKGKKVTFD